MNQQTQTLKPNVIRHNLSFIQWQEKLASEVGQDQQIAVLSAYEPKLLPDAEFENVLGRLKDAEPSAPEITELLAQLRDHAAAFVMAHFPNATYAREDHHKVPTNAALAMFAKHWPATSEGNGAAKPAPPKVNIPKSFPHWHPSQMKRRQTVSQQENMQNWLARQDAAKRYSEEFLTTGKVPPFPIVQDPDDDRQLIERCGWQDFYDHRENPEDIPPPDTSRPAIPGRWLPGQNPIEILAAKDFEKVVKRLSAKRLNNPAELLEPHAQRVIAEERDADPEKARKTRQRMLDKHHGKRSQISKLRHRPGEQAEWRRTTLEKTLQIFDMAEHLSNTYSVHDARKPIRTVAGLAEPIRVIVEDRDVREEMGTSPKSRQAEEDQGKQVLKAIGKLTRMCQTPPIHQHPNVVKFWQGVATLADELASAIDKYQLPEHEAPYEVEDLQAIARTSLDQLRARASHVFHESNEHCDATLMLLHEQWVVETSRPTNHPDQCDAVFNHLSRRFPDQSFQQVVAELRHAEERRNKRVDQIRHNLLNPPEAEDQYEEWHRQTSLDIVADLIDNGISENAPPEAGPIFREILKRSTWRNTREYTSTPMRQNIAAYIRQAYLYAKQERWSKAIAQLDQTLLITHPTAHGMYGSSQMARGAHYQPLNQDIKAAKICLEPLAEAERIAARLNGTEWLVIPTGDSNQMTMMM